jgi:hypothetical protein
MKKMNPTWGSFFYFFRDMNVLIVKLVIMRMDFSPSKNK